MKNSIAPNTKIRILSPEHSEYVQKLAFEAGFEWQSGGKSIIYADSKFLFFKGQEITRGYSEGHFVSVEEPKEIFIDLPAELMTAEYIKKFNSGADVDLSEDKVDFIKDVLSEVGKDLERIINKSDTQKSCNDLDQDQPPATSKHSHYFKDVSDFDEVDVYRVCDLFEVNDNSGAIQHALKKLLCSGQRGAKGYRKDLEEARDSIQRKLDLMAEDGE